MNPTVAMLLPRCVVVNRHVVNPAEGTSNVAVHWFAQAIRVNVPCAYQTQMKRTKYWFEVIKVITIAGAPPLKPYVKMDAADNATTMQIAIAAPAN